MGSRSHATALRKPKTLLAGLCDCLSCYSDVLASGPIKGVSFLVRIEKQLLSSSSLLIQTLARFRNKNIISGCCMTNIKKYTLKNKYTLKRYKVFFHKLL